MALPPKDTGQTSALALQPEKPSLTQNFGLNLLGTLLPLLLALFAIPILLDHFGLARFGLLTLGWSLVGYFSLFDLGIGRALTQRLSTLIAADDLAALGPTYWGALSLLLALGMVGGFALAACSGYLAQTLLKLPLGLQPEAQQTFNILAIAIPVVVLSAALRGSLEAHQRFDLITWVRLPLGFATFGGPLLVVPFTDNLTPAIAVVVGARAAGAVAFFILARRIQPRFRSPSFSAAQLKPLAKMGGWMTVTNVVGPLMGFMDRFFVGALKSVAAVAYYTTPWEFIIRLLIVPGALLNVLFPALASAYESDLSKANLLFENANRYVLLSLFPIVFCLFAFSEELLGLWLGADFAAISAPIANVLLVGVLINTSGSVASTLIQSVGRPDITARVHLVELPIYIAALYYLIVAYGALGAAIAWTVRQLIDSGVLQFFARRLLGNSSPQGWLSRAILLGCGLGLVCSTAFIQGMSLRMSYVAVVLLAYLFISWTWLLSSPDRAFVRGLLRGSAHKTAPYD